MDEVKVNSYEDCIWYLKDIDKCKMPGLNRKYSECECKNGEMKEFCIWVTKFIKSTPRENSDDIELPKDLSMTYEDKTSEDFLDFLNNLIYK